ncbi:hypothetical protein [Niallia circulans]|uniref:hypothetical protein n=2 Tax=Niallia TaxID=2837506 RepID=UPI0003040FCE
MIFFFMGITNKKGNKQMIGLFIAIIGVNIFAFKVNKYVTKAQMVSIWAFTVAFQAGFDIYISFKYHGYWYFDKDAIEWIGLLPHLALVPPVNIIFLNWYPFKKSFIKRLIYFACWTIGILIYEVITLLPEPWGYFHYGWWNVWISVMVDPVLLYILLLYYKWISKLDNLPN